MDIKGFLRPIKRKTFDLLVWHIVSMILALGRRKLEKKHTFLPKNKAILFNTQYHWYHSWIDYTMAAALKYRGYEIKMMICDGLPYCEQETFTIKRPSCEDCYRTTKKRADLFGVNSIAISDLISNEKIIEIGKLVDSKTIDELKDYKYLGVDVGLMALRNFTHFYRGVAEIVKERENVFRKCIESALIICESTNDLIKNISFDKVISPNGKFIQSGIALELSKNSQIDFFTWDMFNQNGAAIFSKNDIAHDQKIDDIWPEIQNKGITPTQVNKVNHYYGLQSKSLNTPFKYYDDKVVDDLAEIRTILSLDSQSKLITLFTNVEWDSTAMGQNHAYFDMFDWVTSIIDFVLDAEGIDLVIRAHPGESKVPRHLKTESQICERVLRKYKKLPTNIKLVKPESNLSSYALSKLSDVSMVYTSTLGLEFALMGIRPWVAATPYYSGKGFTIDIKSHDQFIDFFLGSSTSSKLNDKEIESARILAYTIKFCRFFQYPVFDDNGRFQLFDYSILFNNSSNETINNICNFIEGDRDYLNLGPSAFS